MAGRPPNDLAQQFAQDTLTLTTHELAGKYEIAESTVRDWRLFCKRSLDLEVGYGRPQMHFLDKKEDPGPMDDEDVWALMARMSAQLDIERKAQDHLTVVLDENLPYGVALTGDWHIGMEGVLYDEMDQDSTKLTITAVDLKPLTKKLEDHDVTVTIKRASLSDEGQRYAMLFAHEQVGFTDAPTFRGYIKPGPDSPMPDEFSRMRAASAIEKGCAPGQESDQGRVGMQYAVFCPTAGAMEGMQVN